MEGWAVPVQLWECHRRWLPCYRCPKSLEARRAPWGIVRKIFTKHPRCVALNFFNYLNTTEFLALMQVLTAQLQHWSGVSEQWFLTGNIRQRLLERGTTPEFEMSICHLGNAKAIFIWRFLIKVCVRTPPSYGVMCVGVDSSFEWLIKYCCALSDLWLNPLGTFNRILSFSVCVSSVDGGV